MTDRLVPRNYTVCDDFFLKFFYRFPTKDDVTVFWCVFNDFITTIYKTILFGWGKTPFVPQTVTAKPSP